MAQKLDREKILRSIHNSIPLSIKLHIITHETENFLEDILKIFLVELGQEKINDQLAYCLKELVSNAQKANTKRVYFTEKNLDINKKEDYGEGMKNFKQETLENVRYFLDKQKEHNYYIKIIYHLKGKYFYIIVKNNVEITKTEQIRVFDRIARARAFDSIEEAPATLIDSSEGAGLGIIIIILMLKKFGLNEDSFDIDIDNGETVATMSIPYADVRLEAIDMVTKKLIQEIDKLPQFPENVVQLQKLISDPDSELTDIARQISVDPSLTADLLKLVNSAQFMLPKRVDNIVEAVKLVGLRTLKNLLYSYGTQKIYYKRFKKIKWLWDHSYRAAFYAYTLAKNFKRSKEILDDVYVGGILHDLGQIIFTTVSPNLLDKIKIFCKAKGIPSNIFENLSSGMNHGEIGALIAEKWNFPANLIAAIRYHHIPTESPDQFRDIIYTVYLANAICNIEEEKITYEQLEEEVLKNFNITEKERFDSLTQRLAKLFEQNQSTLM